MAYKQTANVDRNSRGHREYQCEARADIASLPTFEGHGARCEPGSIALVEEDFSVWVLSIDGITWKEV